MFVYLDEQCNNNKFVKMYTNKPVRDITTRRFPSTRACHRDLGTLYVIQN
jgi:5-methylcytosine-specific restriction endonuclease McrA